MTTNDEYVVCLLDVLGFKNLFENLGLETIEKKYRELIAVADKNNIERALTLTPDGNPCLLNPQIKTAYFSDTILFWCPYDMLRLDIFLDCLKEVMCRSIEIGLPLRGAISVGKAILEKENNIFLGQPIISAYLAEQSQKWIGISLSKTFDLPQYKNRGFRVDKIIDYKKHIKPEMQENIIPLVIDFPNQWRKSRQEPLEEVINKLNSDRKFSIYYENTIDFVSYSQENHEWWTKDPSYIEMLEKMNKPAD